MNSASTDVKTILAKRMLIQRGPHRINFVMLGTTVNTI